MKIGLLTFHCAQNYGAMLQCYATQEFLKSHGHQVEVIDYRPQYLLRPYRLFNTQRLKSSKPKQWATILLKELIPFPRRCYLRWAYYRFMRKHLILSREVTKDTIPSCYDVYVVGSDQIWNPRLTGGFDDVYFCRFPFAKATRRYIAYAASMEAKELDEMAEKYYHDTLQHFDALSVREPVLSHLLQPLTHHPISNVLDPTLMVDPKVWESLPANPRLPKKYVLVYQGRSSTHTLRIAKDIAQQIGAEVVALGTWVSFSRGLSYKSLSPEGFIHAIRNAACVVTTSFHGTAFSVIFGRPFYTVKLDDGADSRSQSLLQSLGLSDRMINVSSSPTFSTIDYAATNTTLQRLRKESQEFLLKALN